MNEQPLALTDQLVRQQEEIEQLAKERDEWKRVAEFFQSKTTPLDMDEIELLTKERDELKAKLEQVEACTAERRSVLQSIWEYDEMGYIVDDTGYKECGICGYKDGKHEAECLEGVIEHALSTDCGKGILERVAQLEREVSHRKQVMEITHPVEIQVLNEKVKRLEEVVIELSKELQNEWEDVLRPFCNDATAQHARAVINRACAALAGAKQALETEAK